jgi:hypothetical protein
MAKTFGKASIQVAKEQIANRIYKQKRTSVAT